MGIKHIGRYCEFPGDEKYDHDEFDFKKLCRWAGFEHCTLHKERLAESEDGFRMCSPSCKAPCYERKE